MDHVVDINDGGTQAKPVVVRLLPGEETIFKIKVINHGEPSNISILASRPVSKAVHFKRRDHYVVMEETIPIMARMPHDRRRLDGEMQLTWSGGETRVPVTLLRDSEDPGDDMDDPGPQCDEQCQDDSVGVDHLRSDEDDVLDDEEAEEDRGSSEEADGRNGRFDADDDEDEDDDLGQPKPHSSLEEEDEQGKPKKIAFSKDRDLKSYRSSRPRRAGAVAAQENGRRSSARRSGVSAAKAPENGGASGVASSSGRAVPPGRDGHAVRPAGDEPAADDYEDYEDDDRDDHQEHEKEDRVLPRYRTRVDDRFVNMGGRDGRSDIARDEAAGPAGPFGPSVHPSRIMPTSIRDRFDPTDEGVDDLPPGQDYEEVPQGYRREADRESREMIHRALRDEVADESAVDPPASRVYGAGEDYGDGGDEQDPQSSSSSYSSSTSSSSFMGRLDGIGGLAGPGQMRIVPALIFLALVIVLVMTFITESIPEFTGALGSSILIVTLIIYGAATLLKA